MRKTRKKRSKKTKAASDDTALNPAVHPDGAGIDIGEEELVAAVPPGRCDRDTVRSFSSFTSGVHALRDWLLACRIQTVALESAGNYWITTHAVLEDAGMEVCLVNARHVKGVLGKKTDVQDAQWLQQLHAAGLLRESLVIDLYSRRVVGWSLADHLRTDLVFAHSTRPYKPAPPVTPSSTVIVAANMAGPSSARRWPRPVCGKACPPAPIPTTTPGPNPFIGTLKLEMLQKGCFENASGARTEIFDYIEGYYNTHRKHSALGYQPSNQFEARIHSAN